jgi:hypothetical protein
MKANLVEDGKTKLLLDFIHKLHFTAILETKSKNNNYRIIFRIDFLRLEHFSQTLFLTLRRTRQLAEPKGNKTVRKLI